MKKYHILMLSCIAIFVMGSFVPALGDPMGDWLGRAKVDAKVRADLTNAWNDTASSTSLERLDQFGQIAAKADGRIRYFAGLKLEEWPNVDMTKVDADIDSYPAGMVDNLRLWFARQLALASLYDEAEVQLGKINEDAVFDKMSLHFYRAVTAYRKMDKAATAKHVKALYDYEKENGQTLPERYKVVARLMAEDITGVKDGSLDHIARQMEDIERRLDLGRSGKKVQNKEDDVLKALDKIIEEIEKQQQKQKGQDSTQSTKPAEDSQ
ncbi:MAG: hypothetical protein PVH19_02660, partial [Planctomycetia bacterium]